MENVMGFKKVKDHTGRTRIELSKYWPDRTRYRRYVPNPTVAKKVTARIDEAIAHEFTEKLLNDVEPATVNRSLAVLKNMLGFAVDKEYLAANPLARFKLLPEEQKPTRILSLEEYWRLIECHDDPVAAAYATVLGPEGGRNPVNLAVCRQPTRPANG
jgi:site-specific recombinase XerD